MMRIVTLFASITLLFTFQSSHSAEAAGETQSATNSPDSDHRQLVSMPDETSQLMRKDMLDHLSALNEIIGLLAENNLDAAADVAETRMGKSSMGNIALLVWGQAGLCLLRCETSGGACMNRQQSFLGLLKRAI